MPQFITCLPNDKNNGTESPPSIVTDDAARIEAFRARYDRPGYGVFYCVNPVKRGATRRSRETIECIARLHLDIDFKDVVEAPAEIDRKIDNLPLQPTDIFDSGGGRHLRYELKEPVFLEEDPELFDKVCGLIKTLTAALCADPAPAFPHALLRLPGSHNTKRSKPVLVKRTGGTRNPIDISEIETLVELLSEQPFLTLKPKTNGAPEERKGPLNVTRLLEDMEHRGASGIHMGQVRSTASMLRGGMSVDEAVRQVLEATERKGDPSWDWELEERTIRKQCYDFICKNPELAHALPDDLRETFHAAIAKGRTSIKIVCPSHTKKWQVRGWGGPEGTEDAPALMGGFVLYDANNLEPAEWIIKEMLPASGVLILPGQWGTYKTTTLLDMSYCIMTGTPFAGKYPIKRPGAVMLYALEGFKAVDRRLRAIAEFAGNGNAPLPLYKSDCCPPLSRPEAAGEIIAVIKNVDENAQAVLGMPVRVLWIDTYSNAAGHSLSGDDNDRAATQKVFNTLRTIGRETGVLVAVIDHFGKIAESGTTGSAGKEGNADAVLANMAERELNGTLGNLRMMVRKQRDGRAGFELPFEAEVVDLGSQDEDGDPITGVALKWEAERLAQKAESQSTNDKLFMRALTETLRDHGFDHYDYDRQIRACHEWALREAFYELHPRGDGTEQQFQQRRATNYSRAIKKATAGKRITLRTDGEDAIVFLEGAR